MALEAQGGEITVYASPSNGAQFEIILPLEKASSPALV
jgi:signal transduction histidine kinase